MAMRTLLSLPIEILLEIITLLPVDSLLTLSRTSHQFNTLCQPHFFSRHNISNPSEAFKFRIACTKSSHTVLPTESELLKRKNDPLSGLSTAFDIKSVAEFLVIFHDCDSSHPTAAKLKPYWKLLRVLERLECINKLTIGFDYWYFDNQGSMDRELTMQTKQVVTGLLNVALERGCEAFTIQNSDLFQMPPLFDKVGWAWACHTAKYLNVLRRPAERAIIPYAPLPKGDTIDFIPLLESARKASKVQHLVISASMMLYPPCSYWTYSVLDTPNLTSLTLYRVHLPTEYWVTTLSWLIHPLKNKLLDFALMHSSEVPVEPLITFVTNLTVLTHLKIILFTSSLRNHAPLKRGLGAKGNILPNLVSFESYPDWIALLCPHSIPRPHLTSLEIIPRDKFDYGKSIEDLRPALTHPMFLPSNRNPELRITLNLHACGYTTSQFEEDIKAYMDPTVRTNLGASIYESVTHLMIRLRVFPPTLVGTPEVICKFLAWWKNLECVEFFSVVKVWNETWADVWTKEKIERFLKETRKGCPSMKKVILNEEEYDVCGAV